MNILTQADTPKIIMVEMEVMVTILMISGWGGIVSYLMKHGTKEKKKDLNMCIKQVIISCFTGFILSIIAIDRGLSTNMTVILSGLGGVFATPILKSLGAKVKKLMSENDIVK